MPHPDEDLELPGKPRRRPSHVRAKRRQSATKLTGVSRDAPELSHVIRSPEARREQWRDVMNPAPALPDPDLKRPLPPPAPLPSETALDQPTTPGWIENRERRKRIEDIVGTIVLAIMVTAMLIAMWLRMTGT